MAAPHVAGVLALMVSRYPTISPTGAIASLQRTARAFPAACVGCGAGIVDATEAVKWSGTIAPTITSVNVDTCNGSYELNWSAVPSATSYKIWRRAPGATISYVIGTVTSTSTVVVAYGSGTTAWDVQACVGAACGVPSDPVSRPYYAGCP